MMGIGMVQQMRQTCPNCNGEGNIVRSGDRCTSCRGRCVKTERKTLSLFVEKGMQVRRRVSRRVAFAHSRRRQHGQRITFRGEADEAPGQGACLPAHRRPSSFDIACARAPRRGR